MAEAGSPDIALAILAGVVLPLLHAWTGLMALHIGWRRGYLRDGLWHGMVLGPLGLLTVLTLPRQPRATELIQRKSAQAHRDPQHALFLGAAGLCYCALGLGYGALVRHGLTPAWAPPPAYYAAAGVLLGLGYSILRLARPPAWLIPALGDFDDYPEDPAHAARLRLDYGVALYTEAGRGPSWLLLLNALAFACALITGIAVWLPGNAPVPWWAQALASAALLASTGLLLLLYRRMRWALLRLAQFRERYADIDPRWAPWVPLYLRCCAARLEREVAQADAVRAQAQAKYGAIVIGMIAAPVCGLFTLASFPTVWGGLATAAGIVIAALLYQLHRRPELELHQAQAAHAELLAQSSGVAAEVAHCAPHRARLFAAPGVERDLDWLKLPPLPLGWPPERCGAFRTPHPQRAKLVAAGRALCKHGMHFTHGGLLLLIGGVLVVLGGCKLLHAEFMPRVQSLPPGQPAANGEVQAGPRLDARLANLGAACALLLYGSLAWGLTLYLWHFIYGYQPSLDLLLLASVWGALLTPVLTVLWHLRRTAYWERVQQQLELQPTEQWRRIEFCASFRQAWLDTARHRLRLLWLAAWLCYVAVLAGVYMRYGIGQASGVLPLQHCGVAAGAMLALASGLGVACARARSQARVWQGQLLQAVREMRREEYAAALQQDAGGLSAEVEQRVERELDAALQRDPAEHLLDRARNLAATLPALLLPPHLPLVQSGSYGAYTDVLLLLNLLSAILALVLWGLWLKRLRQVEWVA